MKIIRTKRLVKSVQARKGDSVIVSWYDDDDVFITETRFDITDNRTIDTASLVKLSKKELKKLKFKSNIAAIGGESL